MIIKGFKLVFDIIKKATNKINCYFKIVNKHSYNIYDYFNLNIVII